MNAHKSDDITPVDSNGMLSVKFVSRTTLKVRLLAGTPSLLDLGILSRGLVKRAPKAVFELFEENGLLSNSFSVAPTVPALVDLMHKKFSKAAFIHSLSNTEMAYFDYSNEYFIYLGLQEEIDCVFNLTLNQMADYFDDVLEAGHDEIYLRSIWAIYEPFM